MLARTLLLVSILVICAIPSFGACHVEGCGLVITGAVTDLRRENPEKGFVRFKVFLNVEFSNEGTEPIILFRPDNEANRYWLGAWSLYATENDLAKNQPVFVDGYWQSISGDESYRKLAADLDVKMPSEANTRILKPKESWQFTDDFQITFLTNSANTFPKRRTWAEMQQQPSQLKLKISYELSPWNVEFFRHNLIRNLKKRWRAYGNVLVELGKSRFNHFIWTSEPLSIDFSKAKETS
jgi:hypothetical protein